MSKSTTARESIELYAQHYPQLGDERGVTKELAAGLSLTAGTAAPVLDAGCGEGGSLRVLRRVSPDRWSVGSDLSLTRANLVREDGFDVAVSDCLRLPFASGSVGLVLFRHVIEHLADEVAALREIRRVLRPDGLLYLETPLRLRGAWYWYRNEAGRRVLDPTHLREYESVDQVRALATAAGLETVEAAAYPLRYESGQVLHRILHRLVRSTSLERGRLRRLISLRRPALPVPRYREIRFLARKQ